MASSAVAEVASSADTAEVVSSAFALGGVLGRIFGDVTVGVVSLADTASVVTAGVAFQEVCGDSVMIPSVSGCDYDDYFYDGHYDDRPDYFNYNNLSNFDRYPSVYDFVGLDDYELYHDRQGPDDCGGILCISG